METFDVDSLSEAQKKVRQNQKQNSKAPGWEPLRNPHRTRILKTDPLSKPYIEVGWRRSTLTGVEVRWVFVCGFCVVTTRTYRSSL
jgi:hypothetical protein